MTSSTPATRRPRKRRRPARMPMTTQGAHSPGVILGFSEEKMRFLAEAIPQIVWTAQPDGTVDYMNRRWFAYTGLTEQETYGELKTAVHPDDYLRYKRRWAECIKHRTPYEMEYRFRRASDGMYRWHLGRGVPLKDPRGKVIKWFGTCTDIHGQKEAEAQVRKLNEELETLVLERTAHLLEEVRRRRKTERRHREHVNLLQNMIHLLPMAALATDRHGTILYANEKFRLLFAPHDDISVLISRPCFDVLSIWRERVTVDTLEKLCSHSGPPQIGVMRLEVSLPDGRTFLIERFPGIVDARESGSLILVRDISEEKRIDAVKSNFMSLASHQLRTPLTALRWGLARLEKNLDGRLKPEDIALLERARQSTSAMAQTITTMLAISRVEAGLRTVNASTVPLAGFLETLRSHFEEACAEKEIKLTITCAGDMELRTDPVILREIMENLLTNAVKYTPKGGVIRVHAGREGKHKVKIRVEDTGYGIPAHEHPKVFTKFFRGENVVNVDTSGTGLGLYLVSLLVHAIEAKIDFASEPGRGTTFTLAVPVRG